MNDDDDQVNDDDQVSDDDQVNGEQVIFYEVKEIVLQGCENEFCDALGFAHALGFCLAPDCDLLQLFLARASGLDWLIWLDCEAYFSLRQ